MFSYTLYYSWKAISFLLLKNAFKSADSTTQWVSSCRILLIDPPCLEWQEKKANSFKEPQKMKRVL